MTQSLDPRDNVVLKVKNFELPTQLPDNFDPATSIAACARRHAIGSEAWKKDEWPGLLDKLKLVQRDFLKISDQTVKVFSLFPNQLLRKTTHFSIRSTTRRLLLQPPP
jgi:hypothetical protein